MSKLGELLSLEYGEALTAETRSGDGFPVFGSNGELGRHRRFLVPEPGIVVGRKGSVGEVTWSSEPFWPIDTAYWVNCPREYRRWLYWVLSWLPLKGLDTSTGVPGLNRKDLYEIEIECPAVLERRFIAKILDTVENCVNETEAIIGKLKLVRQGLVHDLLTRGIDSSGELRPLPSEAPHLYKETPIGWIPNEWSFGTLRHWLSDKPRNGCSPQEASHWTGGQMLGLSCLTVNGFRPVQLKPAPRGDKKLEQALLEDGDLLISRANTRDLVGLVGVYRNVGTPCTYPDLMMRLIPSAETSAEFLEVTLQSPRSRRQIQAIASGTSGSMVKINGAGVAALQVAIPKLQEQTSILNLFSILKKKLASESEYASSLKAIKSGLVNDLFTGRVRVTPLLEQANENPVCTVNDGLGE